MSVIRSTAGTIRLSKRLEKAGLDLWIAESSGDAWGKYLVFRKGGRCIGGAGWSLKQAEEKVAHLIAYKDEPNPPPFEYV